MPRSYNCKKCKKTHQPPTGKQCTRDREEPAAEQPEMQNQIMATLLELKAQMAGMEQWKGQMGDRLQSVEEAREPEVEIPEVLRESDEEDTSVSSVAEGAQSMEAITADKLRKDTELMARAADRLARLRLDEEMADSDLQVEKTRLQGKKSGSTMIALDIVRQRIDWPHLYVKRMVAGRRKYVAYIDLRMEEFVYGYIAMLAAPKCTMNKDCMIQILGILMQDAMDFSWTNALEFYLQLGLDVEKGDMNWTDMDKIRDMRILHSRAVQPERKENKEQQKTPTRVNNGPLKNCALYQRHACEHFRDHPPFAHTCSYCARTVNMTCRHPEADCNRKLADEAKNSTRRE